MKFLASPKSRSPLAFMLLLSAIIQADGQPLPDAFALTSNEALKEVTLGQTDGKAPIRVDQEVTERPAGQTEVSYTQNNKYKWKSVKVKLLDGKSIDGKLISVTGDSLVIQHGHGSKKIQRRIGYSEIAFVGIHRNGAGGLGGLVGGLAGGGIGYLVAYTAYTEPQPSRSFLLLSVFPRGGEEFVLGAVAGTCVGAVIGSSHKKHPIDGNKEKFELLLKKISKQGGTTKILSKGNS